MTMEALIPNQWQALPGGGEARLYPCIPRFSGNCSNAFLIETAESLVLIDIGGEAGQAALLADQIRALWRAGPRPLLLLLTHAHFDHFIGLFSQPELLDGRLTALAVQEAGARALCNPDLALTQAMLLELNHGPLPVDLPLLAAGEEGLPRYLNLANGLRLGQTGVWREAGLAVQRLQVEGLTLDLIHTPGHSPDHCCLRIGGLILVGDLLLAAKVAGVVGWDHEALLTSLAGMSQIIGGEDIRVVCPGHGPALHPVAATAALAEVARSAEPLKDIAELNAGRARWLADFAEVALPEVGRLFLIMVGRLSMASYFMAELSVRGAQDRLPGLIRVDLVDQLLEGFSEYGRQVTNGHRPPISVALKAGEVVRRLQRAFDFEGLGLILDPSLIRRSERLLADYLLLLRGFAPVRTLQPAGLGEVLEAVLAAHRWPEEGWEEWQPALKEEADFDDWLFTRIARRPLLDAVRVNRVALPSAQPVFIDPERFQDLLTTLIEHLVATGTQDIRLGMETQGPTQIVSILASIRQPVVKAADEAPRPYLLWLSHLAGVHVNLASNLAAGLYGYRIQCQSSAAGQGGGA